MNNNINDVYVQYKILITSRGVILIKMRNKINVAKR